MTIAAIDAELATFTINRNALRELGQKIALMIINHAAPIEAGPLAEGHGNCDRLLRLAEVMPKSWASQLSAFLIANTPIRVVMRKTVNSVGYDPKYKALRIDPTVMTQEEMDKVKEERLTWWNIPNANLIPFYEYDEPNAEEKLELMGLAQLLKIVEAAAKRAEKSVEDGKVIPSEVFTYRSIANQLKAIRVEHIEEPKAEKVEKPKKVKAEKVDVEPALMKAVG